MFKMIKKVSRNPIQFNLMRKNKNKEEKGQSHLKKSMKFPSGIEIRRIRKKNEFIFCYLLIIDVNFLTFKF